MAVIGIEINEVSQSTSASLPNGFIACHMAVNNNYPAASIEELNSGILITSLNGFVDKFGVDYDGLVKNCVDLFFQNHEFGRLWFYQCSDPDIAEDDEESLVGNLEYGLNKIAENTDLELGFLVVPETYLLSETADITKIYSAARLLAETQEWLYLGNHTISVSSKEDIITQREPFTSPLGHCAFYGSSAVLESGDTIPITPIVAAIGLKRSAGGNGTNINTNDSVFSPPGGADYPILGIISITPYFSSTTDFRELKDADINIVQKIPPDIGYCIWGARTLAADDITNDKFGQINTRMAVSITIKRLEVALTPLLFDSIDPQGFTRREIIRVIRQTMNQIYLEGGLTGNDANDSYRVEEIIEDENDNLRRIRINIYARFVSTLEEIAITLISTDNVNVLV